MSREVEQFFQWALVNHALDELAAQLDAAGVTDRAERARARRLLIDQIKTQRAAAEAVGAVKH